MKFPAYFDIAEASEKGFGEFKAVIDKYSENLESVNYPYVVLLLALC